MMAGHVEHLDAYGTLPATAHVFDDDSREAVNAALAAQRPLLVRGEPGTGKSQLARAVASYLKRAYVAFTVDARTEARDLLYTVDTVARLAEAQILGHVAKGKGFDVKEELAESKFTAPGPLWWVFDWGGAETQLKAGRGTRPWTPRGWKKENGAVLLVDEIDKADTAVPNGLLEALGHGEFPVPGGTRVSAGAGDVRPLVIITTNEERALPDAFVRRCLVLQMSWPDDADKLIQALQARGRAHFGEEVVSDEVLKKAAEMVAEDRATVAGRGVCPPGGAEYLDLLRAVAQRWPGDGDAQEAALGRIRKFALDKHPDEATW